MIATKLMARLVFDSDSDPDLAAEDNLFEKFAHTHIEHFFIHGRFSQRRKHDRGR